MPIHAATAADLTAITAVCDDVFAAPTAIRADDPLGIAERAAWFAIRRPAGSPALVADAGGLDERLGSTCPAVLWEVGWRSGRCPDLLLTQRFLDASGAPP